MMLRRKRKQMKLYDTYSKSPKDKLVLLNRKLQALDAFRDSVFVRIKHYRKKHIESVLPEDASKYDDRYAKIPSDLYDTPVINIFRDLSPTDIHILTKAYTSLTLIDNAEGKVKNKIRIIEDRLKAIKANKARNRRK